MFLCVHLRQISVISPSPTFVRILYIFQIIGIKISSASAKYYLDLLTLMNKLR